MFLLGFPVEVEEGIVVEAVLRIPCGLAEDILRCVAHKLAVLQKIKFSYDLRAPPDWIQKADCGIFLPADGLGERESLVGYDKTVLKAEFPEKVGTVDEIRKISLVHLDAQGFLPFGIDGGDDGHVGHSLYSALVGESGKGIHLRRVRLEHPVDEHLGLVRHEFLYPVDHEVMHTLVVPSDEGEHPGDAVLRNGGVREEHGGIADSVLPFYLIVLDVTECRPHQCKAVKALRIVGNVDLLKFGDEGPPHRMGEGDVCVFHHAYAALRQFLPAGFLRLGHVFPVYDVADDLSVLRKPSSFVIGAAYPLKNHVYILMLRGKQDRVLRTLDFSYVLWYHGILLWYS